MKKAIGGFILGAVFGWFCMSELISLTADRGPTIYDDEEIKIKQCQTKGGKLLNLAMIFDKLN